MSAWQVLAAANLVVATAYLAVATIVIRGRLRARAGIDHHRARERQAFEINDNIVQGLARVKWALEAGRADQAHAAADETLVQAQKMVTDLLTGEQEGEARGAERPRREVPVGVAVAAE